MYVQKVQVISCCCSLPLTLLCLSPPKVDWNTDDQAEVLVFARKGSWFGFQNDREAWPHLLVNTTVFKPSSFPDRSTSGPYVPIDTKMLSAVVPSSAFTPLTMKPGETWALYVCMSNADLRYTMGTSIGQAFAASPELRIMEGAGAADFPPFGSGLPEYGGVEYTFYAPRVFNGNLRYDFVGECPSEAPSALDFVSLSPTPVPTLATSVTYTFFVEHSPRKLISTVLGDIEQGTTTVLTGFILNETNPLHDLALNHGLAVTSLVARVADASANPGKPGCT
jgi:hypothetical protein